LPLSGDERRVPAEIDVGRRPALKRRLAIEILDGIRGLNDFYIAASVLEIDPSRLSDLRRGREARFTIDRLIRILVLVDRRVDIEVVNAGPAERNWLRFLKERRAARSSTLWANPRTGRPP
jgi:predicted XRE-type DNA-binding protein